MKYVYIDGDLPQWKGNLHMHTTRSDGDVSPEQAAEIYYKKGFHFIAITDHERYWDSECLNREGFLVLGGLEGGIERSDCKLWEVGARRNLVFHIHALRDYSVEVAEPFVHEEAITRRYDYGLSSWQEQIDVFRQKGNLTIINHPRWSRLEPYEMLALHGYFALEIWNDSAEVCCSAGESEYEWDYCLRHGKRMFAVAADDAHEYFHESDRLIGNGYTMVCAPALTPTAISTALGQGHFYASLGPVIEDMRVEGNRLKMRFSSAQEARLVSWPWFSPAHFSQSGVATLTSAEWELTQKNKYVRPEIIGADGKKAWGPPVFMDDVFEKEREWHRYT